MPLLDSRGVPVGSDDPAVVLLLEAATMQLSGFAGDPVGEARAALARDPDQPMAHALLAGTFAMSLHPALTVKARRHLEAGLAQPRALPRERLHLAAIGAWLDGDLNGAGAIWDQLLHEHPRDLAALFMAHQGDFFGTATGPLARRPSEALGHWSPDLPGYGRVLGMLAFGLEEEGAYPRAETTAREAVDRDPRDVWAIHAIGHVMEMQGRDEEGIAWYTSREADWRPGSFFAVHNAWHLALFHVDADDAAGALAVYDRLLAPAERSLALNLADAVALLWRLHLAEVDVGERWQKLAELADRQMAAGCHAFVDVHAVFALAGAGFAAELRKRTATLAPRADGSGDYHRRLRNVVLPVARAMLGWCAGDYREAADVLAASRAAWPLMTGSLAQREILPLTLTEALLRAGDRSAARALLEERLARKPASRAIMRDLGRAGRGAAHGRRRLLGR